MTQPSSARSSETQRDVRALLLLDAGVEAMSAAALTAAALATPHMGAWQLPRWITSVGLGCAATGFAGTAVALAVAANRLDRDELGRISIPLAALGSGNAVAAAGLGVWGAIGDGIGGGVRVILVASGISVAGMGVAQIRLARRIV